jgi:hypothetical protein
MRRESDVEAVALKWFTQMQTGQIDCSQLIADYNAQLTDAAMQGRSRYLRNISAAYPQREPTFSTAA